MITCKADPSIQRVTSGNFQFPLGAYPVEPLTPRPGFSMHFEPADGDDESGEWEEWPDRYVYDVVISAERVEPLCRMLFSVFPGRVYPILDVLGHDHYREIDPYISYDLVGLDRFTDAVRRFRDFLLEDGMCGFGAMSEEPFFYIFIDEHKIITLRCEPGLKEKVEKILSAFDLEQVEEPAGADAAAHEHRGVLMVPSDKPDLLSQEEIVERLKDEWSLLLNVDPDTNMDDEGRDLGVTPWRVIVRCEYENKPARYAEVLLDAPNLREAEEVAFDAVDELVSLDPPEPPAPPPNPPTGPLADAAGTTKAAEPPLPPADPNTPYDPNDPLGLGDPGPAEEVTWEDAIIVAADRLGEELLGKLLAAAQASTGKKVTRDEPQRPAPAPLRGGLAAHNLNAPGDGNPAVRSARWLA